MSSKAKQIQIEKPIFLLGVGRCGSTMLQLRLSRVDDVWIWGEHGGILRTIFDWAAQVRDLPDLNRFAFAAQENDLRRFVQKPFRQNPTHLAWLNGFRPSDIVEAERSIVTALMKRGLPRGKRRWGFKEIRYGIDDNVPDQLLTLFPEAKIIHTIRHPSTNVESAVFEWSFDQLKAAVDNDDREGVEQVYDTFASRWSKSAEYFHDLSTRHPNRVFTSHLERQDDEAAALCDFLEIDPEAFGRSDKTESVNSGQAIKHYENEKYLRVLRDVGRDFATSLHRVAKLHGYDVER